MYPCASQRSVRSFRCVLMASAVLSIAVQGTLDVLDESLDDYVSATVLEKFIRTRMTAYASQFPEFT
jgi:hypothetical protein